MIDVEQSRAALRELRHARRHNHRDVVHWVDALYRVYITGLIAIGGVIAGAGLFGDVKMTPAEQQAFMTTAVPYLGLAFAAAVAIGLRSGGRGGPLTLEAATVHYELLAPIPRSMTLRSPAFKQARFLAFGGLVLGAVVGVLAVRRFPENPVGIVVPCAIAFAAAAVLAISVAMIASGQRIGRPLSNVLAVAVLAWSALDIALQTTTSPLTLLGRFAFNGVSFDPLAIMPVVLAAAAFVVALAGIGGTSIDDARRRAGLVSQLRFAVTLQDIRTVVLLRRQLSQEVPRGKPWIRLGRGGRTPAIWQRDFRSFFRYPITRVARMVLLASVAGVCLGLTWTAVRPAFLISAVALYLAAYDAVEPLAQEVDHPSRWDGMPDEHGKILLWHLPAALLVMVLLCLVTTGTAMLVAPPEVVLAVAAVLILPVAGAAVTGAALSAVMGSPDVAKLLAGLGADVIGFVLLLRLLFPPALTAIALLPMFAIGTDITKLDTTRMSNNATWAVVLCVFGLMYIRYQKPARV